MDMSNRISHRFDYLLKKIRRSDFSLHPFRHVEIKNFFSEEDFQEITTANEISTSASNDPALIEVLLETGYRFIVIFHSFCFRASGHLIVIYG